MTLDEKVAAAVRDGKMVATLNAWDGYEQYQYRCEGASYIPFFVYSDHDETNDPIAFAVGDYPQRERVVPRGDAKRIVIAGRPPETAYGDGETEWTEIEVLGEYGKEGQNV